MTDNNILFDEIIKNRKISLNNGNLIWCRGNEVNISVDCRIEDDKTISQIYVPVVIITAIIVKTMK